MRLLSFSEAVRYSGEGRNTLRMNRDFGTLVVICFPDGTKGIRESEVMRWMAEMIETRAANVRARESASAKRPSDMSAGSPARDCSASRHEKPVGRGDRRALISNELMMMKPRDAGDEPARNQNREFDQ